MPYGDISFIDVIVWAYSNPLTLILPFACYYFAKWIYHKFILHEEPKVYPTYLPPSTDSKGAKTHKRKIPLCYFYKTRKCKDLLEKLDGEGPIVGNCTEREQVYSGEIYCPFQGWDE